MLPRIKQLPDDLITRIAAGEVIERPASLLKELIENSLDAGSTKIEIAIEGAGRTKISISDNGCGMTPEEAKLSLKRHATSKISALEDLETIQTYGFRGEALPSMASVSKLRLVTRPASDSVGSEIVIAGGKIVREAPAPREAGTSITVSDLFFNTPARFKFLKSDSTERGQCLKVIEEMSYAAPLVTFHVTVEKNKPLVFQSGPAKTIPEQVSTLQKRINVGWGSRFQKGMLTVDHQTRHFQVKGLVSDAYTHQGTTRYQYLYINNRPVQNRRLTRAVYEAFRGSLPSLRHPAWVLFLDVDPRSVDVNVHPAKREVKLTHENELFGFMMEAVTKAIREKTESPIPGYPRYSEGVSTPRIVSSSVGELYRPLNVKPASSAPLELLTGTSFQPVTIKGESLQGLAQIRKMFILAQGKNDVYILDQHAAAERVTYERLLNKIEKKETETQMLLVPFTWEVALSVLPAVKGKLSVFQSMGFLMEPFGDDAFLIKGYPAVLGEKFDLPSLLDGVSDSLHQKDFQHQLAAMAACKSSVRAGDSLSPPEIQSLLDQIVACEAPMTCPHGRPTTFQMSYSELERKFRRN